MNKWNDVYMYLYVTCMYIYIYTHFLTHMYMYMYTYIHMYTKIDIDKTSRIKPSMIEPSEINKQKPFRFDLTNLS